MGADVTQVPVDNLDVEVRLLRQVTVLSGNTVSRGDLVAYDGVATTKVVPFLTGEDPYTVMYEDVDASAGDAVGYAYRDAVLKASEVNYGTGSKAEVLDALDQKNIFLVD